MFDKFTDKVVDERRNIVIKDIKPDDTGQSSTEDNSFHTSTPKQCLPCDADMRKGTDTWTLTAEVLLYCGNLKPATLNITLICNQKWKNYGIIVHLKKIYL